MKHLYMMRHGQTLFNVRKRIQGSCDSPLTELGIKQAEAARELIKDIAFDHYYSSTAERASDTLEIVTEGQVPYTRESEDLNPHFDDFKYDDLFPHYGGETTKQVQHRVVKTLTEIMNKEDHEVVLAVSHAGASMQFFSAFNNPAIIFNSGGLTNCCILHYTYDNNEFKFVEILRPEVK